jgi:ABC-type branched-subunit amino acid transport system ATPase component
LDGVDLDLFEGELVVLLGPSGSGKSTLLNILGGLDAPTEGTLTYRGEDLTQADEKTLRVVGFTRREVATVLIGELALLTLLAIPVGLLIGSQLANLIVRVSSTESVRLPLVLSSQTYATAALIVFLSSGLSFAIVSRRIRNLDLLSVRKARE